MAKELPFFKFEVSEWMFGRIQKQPANVQGIFINLCCKYWHKLGDLSFDDACLDFDEESLNVLLKYKIIGTDSGFIVIKFLDEQLTECEKLSKINSLKGKASAEARAKRRQQNSTAVEPLLTVAQPNPTEEKREEKRREKKHAPDVFESKQTAFEDLRDNDQYIEDCVRVLSGRGWLAANPMDTLGCLKQFLNGKLDLRKPRDDIKQHFKNWLIREDLKNLQTFADVFKSAANGRATKTA
jgi:hypothetical protein